MAKLPQINKGLIKANVSNSSNAFTASLTQFSAIHDQNVNIDVDYEITIGDYTCKAKDIVKKLKLLDRIIKEFYPEELLI